MKLYELINVLQNYASAFPPVMLDQVKLQDQDGKTYSFVGAVSNDNDDGTTTTFIRIEED